MDIPVLLDALHIAERLKDTPRHCHTSGGRRESVAEHSWRLALLAYLIRDEFPNADMDKVIRMCLVHDLGEAFTGDIPVFLKTDADSRHEDDLMDDWLRTLPAPYETELLDLFAEMRARETQEARIYKMLDGLEAVLQHNEAGPDDWQENEYDLQRHYGFDRAAFSPYLTQLRQAVRDESAALIAAKSCSDGITIRRAVPADEDAAAELYEEIFDAQDRGDLYIGWVRGIYPTRETVRAGIKAHDLFVLETDGMIAAVGRINRMQMPEYAHIDWQYIADDSKVTVLHTLAVRPSCIRHSLGREFLAFYHRYAAESGSPYLRIDTNELNTRARAFYKKFGYREAGMIPTIFNGIPDINLICLEHAPEADL